MSDFQFANPTWGWGLLGVAVAIAAVFWFERRGGDALERFVSRTLQSRLVERPAASRRYARIAALALAATLLVVALMRPQWGLEYVAAPHTSAELMIALDVSKSMLAEDVAPNRLERAKAEIRDLLEYLASDHVGLIAFSGRATVVSPLTNDFGFLRLVLDGLGPHSVGRGGTRLEEPIRRAVAGFRATDDVSRVLMLITDGEDHDSFPLEAARDAAEKGVRIVAIGFGSETGSEIPITDPETGARTLLRDGDGRIVRSRLDGETLRAIALETGGVYVPAATGVLDLEAIYERHIRNLMRGEVDGRGRAVRKEGFQWALLAALGALLLGAALGRPAAAAGALALLAGVLAGGAAQAQETHSTNASSEAAASAAVAEPALDPRKTYNDALEALTRGELDEAERGFTAAAHAAGFDGEARFRARYGLGWVAASRADAAREADPEAALEALAFSAGAFRDAVRLRPESEDARFNLDLVLKRAMILEDSLRDANAPDLAAALDGLIGAERALTTDLRATVERAIEAERSGALEGMRGEFRGLSTAQRELLSEADTFAERVGGERDAIRARAEEPDAPPDERMRDVQLTHLLAALHRARARMGQARRGLRQRQAGRAYGRATRALRELKRARDALRDPRELLDALLTDGTVLARETRALEIAGRGLPGLETDASAPAWLTVESLRDAQTHVTERTAELHERLAAGAQQLEAAVAAGAPGEADGAAQADLAERVRAAAPLVATARGAFERAGTALMPEASDLTAAATAQVEALAALVDARERFLDLKGLIEVAYADERRVAGPLATETDALPDEATPIGDAAFEEFVPLLTGLQTRNVERMDRVGAEVEKQRASLPPDVPDDDPARSGLEMASQLAALTQGAMNGVLDALGGTDGPDRAGAAVSADRAIAGLESLRRIFFSTAEHLREAAQRQQTLNDDTDERAGLVAADPSRASRAAPLAAREDELAEVASEIATALERQSREDAALPGAGPPDPEAEAARSEALRRAGELVLEGETAMREAARALGGDPVAFESAGTAQKTALAKLLEALPLLVPPQSPPEGEPERQDEPSDDASSQTADADQARRDADPAQLLQGVRDREARRQRERARRSAGSETVEKDW